MENLPDFKQKKVKIAKFGWYVPVEIAKNIEGFWLFLLSYLVCSQIWLNHIMDDHDFSYIKKLEKKTVYAVT